MSATDVLEEGAQASTPEEVAAARQQIGFVLAAARALHRYGTPAHRLEEAVEIVGARLGLHCEVFSTPTAIIMSFGAPAELRTRMMRAESVELNMAKLEAVDAVAEKVADRELTAAQGLAELARITGERAHFSARAVTLAQALSSAAMAVFFGGGLADVAAAGAIGLALGLLGRWAHRAPPTPWAAGGASADAGGSAEAADAGGSAEAADAGGSAEAPAEAPAPAPRAAGQAEPRRRRVRRSRRIPVVAELPPLTEPAAFSRVFELVAAMVASVSASLLAVRWPIISASLVTVASLIVLLPGLSLTVAMTELATGNLISGTARLMAAVIVLLELVVGVAIGERIATHFVTVPRPLPAPLPEWGIWVSLVVAVVGVSVLLQSRWRNVGWILVACVAGTLGSRAGAGWLGHDLGVVVGAFALGVSANIYARVLDRPAQAVLVPAVLLLVPGSIGFRGMSSLLDRDTLSGVDAMFAMFVVATAIVAGLLLASSMVSPRRVL
jgi:uncharacterized membrane protein YjjP (DUF1212 family)